MYVEINSCKGQTLLILVCCELTGSNIILYELTW